MKTTNTGAKTNSLQLRQSPQWWKSSALKPPRSLALPLYHLGAGPSFGSLRLLFQVKDAAVIVLDEVYLRAAKATSSMVIHMVM